MQMSTDDPIGWDKQHANSPGELRPANFLRAIVESDGWPMLRGTALDLACGQGRNAIYLAQRGFAVTALDISQVALAEGRWRAQQQGLPIDWQQCDLEASELVSDGFDLVISFNYLQRSLFRALQRAVKPGGHVICETFLVDQAAIGRPKNPDYLLQHNELLDCFRAFRVLSYHEGLCHDGVAPAFRAGIFAQRME
jgi:tellurite methyltransferase